MSSHKTTVHVKRFHHSHGIWRGWLGRLSVLSWHCAGKGQLHVAGIPWTSWDYSGTNTSVCVVYSYVHMYTGAFSYSCRSQRRASGVLIYHSLSYTLRHGLSLNLDLTVCSARLVNRNEPSGFMPFPSLQWHDKSTGCGCLGPEFGRPSHWVSKCSYWALCPPSPQSQLWLTASPLS